MNRIACVLIAGIIATAFLVNGPHARADDVERDRFAGEYRAAGVGNEGRKYEAVVTIKRTGKTYEVHWRLHDGTEYFGIGLAAGSVLSVAWHIEKSAGVAVYDFSAEKVSGTWSVLASEDVYTEELRRK